MPRRPTRTVPTVILHGLDGPGPEHWYSWLATELTAAGREVRRPSLPDSHRPELTRWRAELGRTLAGLPDGGFDLLCHSLGCLLWLHHVRSATVGSPKATSDPGSPRPSRVLLVAPPDPTATLEQAASFFPVPMDRDAVRRAADGTALAAGDDDPWCPQGAAAAYGLPLGLPTTVMPGAGHVNPDAGYGPWPAALDWCGRDNLAFIA